MLVLERFIRNSNLTKGILKLGNEPICYTLELPYVNNKRNISCIPEGKYKLRQYSSIKYPNVLQLIDVPNRSYILIHAGNTVKDTRGCILVGELSNKTDFIKRSIVNLSKIITMFNDDYFDEILIES